MRPKGFTEGMDGGDLLPRLKNPSFELDALEAKQPDEVLRLPDDSLRRKSLTREVVVPLPDRSGYFRQPIRSSDACVFVEEIGAERDQVAVAASKQIRHWPASGLADDVVAGHLDGSEGLFRQGGPPLPP